MSLCSLIILLGIGALTVVMLHPATWRWLDELDGISQELGQMDEVGHE